MCGPPLGQTTLNTVILKTSEPSGLRSATPRSSRRPSTCWCSLETAGSLHTTRTGSLRSMLSKRRGQQRGADGDLAGRELPSVHGEVMGYRSVRAARADLGVLFENDSVITRSSARCFRAPRSTPRRRQINGLRGRRRPEVFVGDVAPDVYLRGGQQMTLPHRVRQLDGADRPTECSPTCGQISFHGVGYEGGHPSLTAERTVGAAYPRDVPALVTSSWTPSAARALRRSREARTPLDADRARTSCQQARPPSGRRGIRSRSSRLEQVMETHTGGRFDVCKVTRKQLVCVDTNV